jgi:hypothetical protein
MLAMFALALAPLALGQQSQSNPQVPEDALSTRQLIAWSALQKPQPAPQPLPPTDTPIPQPDQPSDQQANPPANPHAQKRPTESFSGKIVKDGKRYCLQSGSKTYELSELDVLQSFENQSVRVLGSLDDGDTIRVLKIELLS